MWRERGPDPPPKKMKKARRRPRGRPRSGLHPALLAAAIGIPVLAVALGLGLGLGFGLRARRRRRGGADAGDRLVREKWWTEKREIGGGMGRRALVPLPQLGPPTRRSMRGSDWSSAESGRGARVGAPPCRRAG